MSLQLQKIIPFFSLFLCLFSSLSSAPPYHSLDPNSIAKQLAFYELYPDTQEGKQALLRAWQLLSDTASVPAQELKSHPLLTLSASKLIAVLTQRKQESQILFSQEELELIQNLGKRLLNRKLQGYFLWSEEAVLKLVPEEIDLARALLLSQLGSDPSLKSQILSYEALLDLMALQILVKVGFDAPAEEKIRAINSYLFQEMRVRFPPHSLYAKEIDLYTFLPAVLDSRRGVCLGVCTLYLCLAQRIGLSLEAITPPGHIYVRYRDADKIINIETTARGIHVNCEEYLSIQMRSLPKRTIKEVVGMTFMNQGSTLWQNGQIKEAIATYEKGLLYASDDLLLQELLGYCLLIDHQEEKGRALLAPLKNYRPEESIESNTLIADYLDGQTSVAGIQSIFLAVDETHPSILNKQKAIQEVLNTYPHFRTGWFALGVTYLQLGRQKEALSALERYHSLDAHNPVAAYYLAILSAERLNYPAAWSYLREAEKITAAFDSHPKSLTKLRFGLQCQSPE